MAHTYPTASIWSKRHAADCRAGRIGPIMRMLVALFVFSLGLPAQRPLGVSGLEEDAPLTVSASADATRLLVDLRIEAGWHVYARDVGGGDPVRISVIKGSGFEANGELQMPGGVDGKLTGSVRLVQPLVRQTKGRPLRATLSFTICDPLQCLPPMDVSLRGPIEPLRILLVVGVRDEHAARIEAFLRKRGFAPSVTTYAEVDLKSCDAHDVVLADSKLFRENRGALKHALEFPKTKSPIVAVGFLGTELIEAQGLAMTSGYI